MTFDGGSPFGAGGTDLGGVDLSSGATTGLVFLVIAVVVASLAGSARSG